MAKQTSETSRGSASRSNEGRPNTGGRRPRNLRRVGRGLLVAGGVSVAVGAVGESVREPIDYFFKRKPKIERKISTVVNDSKRLEAFAGDIAKGRLTSIPAPTKVQIKRLKDGRLSADKIVPPMVERTPHVSSRYFESSQGRAAVVNAYERTADEARRLNLQRASQTEINKVYQQNLRDSVDWTLEGQNFKSTGDLLDMQYAVNNLAEGLPVLGKLGLAYSERLSFPITSDASERPLEVDSSGTPLYPAKVLPLTSQEVGLTDTYLDKALGHGSPQTDAPKHP